MTFGSRIESTGVEVHRHWSEESSPILSSVCELLRFQPIPHWSRRILRPLCLPSPHLVAGMAKRPAEDADAGDDPLKAGQRPVQTDNGDEAGPFEDEFEDEFESEDEIVEAGVDGRPDEERELEEKRGMWTTLERVCGIVCLCRWL